MEKKGQNPKYSRFCLGSVLERPLTPVYEGSLISQFKDPKDGPQNSSTEDSEVSYVLPGITYQCDLQGHTFL